MNNVWFFVMISQSDAGLIQYFYYTNGAINPTLAQTEFTTTWQYDSSFKVELGGISNDMIYFNGLISKPTLILDFSSITVNGLNPYRYGIPRFFIRIKNCVRFQRSTKLSDVSK